jgi:energy-coupling factor transporter ATP-binding protein EcfA2
MAGSAPLPKSAPVAVAGSLRPGEEAAAEALAQLDYGEAPQIGLLGDTGAGKSTAALEIIKLYLKKSPGSVFIVDDKELTTKFEGQQRRDRDDLREHPIDWELGRVVVFRGDVGHGQRVDLEEVAELAWARAQRGRKTLCVFDELVAGREELTKNACWRKDVTWVPRNFTMGRSPGIGDLWGAQSPQLVPIDPFEQSSAIITFRLAGMGLQRLKERDYLLGGAGEVIARLPGPPLPPAQRGEFVLLRRGQPWNGKIYKFNKGGK